MAFLSTIIPSVFIFIFGICIGSFLNCVIYRIEEDKKITGRSFCPHCKHKLSWQDLFPVFSFLFLGGKCRYCRKKISWQYPLVEIATGILFVLIFNIHPISTLYQFISVLYLLYISSALIVIFIYDLKHYLIPDKILLLAIIITFVFRFLEFLNLKLFLNFKFGFLNYLSAALIASGFFFIIWFVSKGRWMGFGDVKLAVLMGLLLGMPNVLTALFLAFFFGAIIGLTLMVFPFGAAQGWEKKNLKSEIPFGPFLIAGTFLALFWGDKIIKWYIQLFQI